MRTRINLISVVFGCLVYWMAPSDMLPIAMLLLGMVLVAATYASLPPSVCTRPRPYDHACPILISDLDSEERPSQGAKPVG